MVLLFLLASDLTQMMKKLISNAQSQTNVHAPLQTDSNISNVPGLLSATFVGRERELRWLEDILISQQPVRTRKRVGLYGMTGIGKTQIVSIGRETLLVSGFMLLEVVTMLMDADA
jgi:hypothetical protein